MKSRVSIILAISILIIGFGLYWFHETYERAEREVNSGYSGEAWLNNYLAAIRFLDKTGHQVDYKSSLLSMGALPPSTDVMIIPTQRFDIGPERVDSIINWVKSGGHLIIRAFKYNRDTNRTDYLLDELGLEVVNNDKKQKLDFKNKTETPDTAESNPDTKPDAADKGHEDNRDETENDPDTMDNPLIRNLKPQNTKEKKKKKSTFMARVTAKGEPKEIRMSKSFYLKNSEDEYFSTWTVSDGNGDTLIEVGVGDGRVTILNTLHFLTNSQINKYDHASFLWHMVNPGKRHPKVWLILNDDMPALYKLLYKHARYAVISFIVLLFIWIAYASRRFGARLPATPLSRRELAEHIHAAGNFLWQSQEQHALIEASKQAIYNILAKSQPHWLQLKEPQLINKLAALCQLPQDEVTNAFNVKHAMKELDFIKTMQTLSTIRNQL